MRSLADSMRSIPAVVAAAFWMSLTIAAPAPAADSAAWQPGLDEAVSKLSAELLARYGAGQRERIERGLHQVADFWREDDGDAEAFADFARTYFAGDDETLDAMFERYERLLEQLGGHMAEIGREFRAQSELTLGPLLPFDEIFAAYDVSAHVTDDFFENKLAFVVLLNFPLTTLEQRLTEGTRWTRRQWAEARLADGFSKRIPSSVKSAIAEASAASEQYIAGYNIWMHHLLDEQGVRLFQPKLRLLSHWNLRDEIKASYSGGSDALAKQRMIQRVMERIVDQTIPDVVIDNPHVDWNPYTNEVSRSPVSDSDLPEPEGMRISSDPEPDTRYEKLLGTYLAARMADPYSPTAPTLIDRRFNEHREIPEERVKAMLHDVLTSPMVTRVAALIESRLGRPLEPFDIWYNGFRSSGAYSEAELDSITAKRYPTAKAYEKDIPRMLRELGFPPQRADYIAANIVVEPARGSGHALGAQMRSAKARLRTRVEKDGMNYKGYNIAVHEMGHNVEQTLSLNDIDHTLLNGVPNTAFTEALAFVFQDRDLELLGLAHEDEMGTALKTLNKFWGTFEIGAVGLVDIGVWHWMYDHPDCAPAELKEATIRISQDVWNEYCAPVFGKKDVTLLGVYSHMISYSLYLPDYPIGYLIAHQIEEKMRKAGSVGPDFERVCKIGRVAPDIWMTQASGAPVGAAALLAATERALQKLEPKSLAGPRN